MHRGIAVSAPINVIISMGGLSVAFAQEGYRSPPPLRCEYRGPTNDLVSHRTHCHCHRFSYAR